MSRNRTVNFLASPRHADGTEWLPGVLADDPTFVPRLSFKTSDLPTDPATLAEILRSISSDVAVFLDTNIWDLRFGAGLWPALLSRSGGIYVTPGVRIELEPWRQRHPTFPGSVAVSQATPPIQLLGLPSDPVELTTLVYYTSLLAVRRDLLRLHAAKFLEIHGRSPTPSESIAGIQHVYGERALSLVHKQGQDAPLDRRATDEYLVYAAAAHCLSTGEPTLILTQDQDVMEQFYKLWWFLDTHYRAMLLADEYVSDPFKYPHYELPRTAVTENQFEFDGALLVDRGPRRMRGVLPPFSTFASAECWLISGHGTRLVFGAERQMKRLLDIKGRTAGLVSEDLRGRNLHAYLGGTLLERTNPRIVQNCVAIVRDHAWITPEPQVRLALLDIQYALFGNERVTLLKRGREHRPRHRLWIPPGALRDR